MRRCSRGHFVRAGGRLRCRACRKAHDHRYSISEKGKIRRRRADAKYQPTLQYAMNKSRSNRVRETKALEAQRGQDT